MASLTSLPAHSGRITGKPEIIGSSSKSVPTNALVLTGLANFLVVGKQEVIRFLPVGP